MLVKLAAIFFSMILVLCAQMLKNGAAFVLPDGYEAAPSADNLGYAVCVLTGNQDSAG